MKNLVLCLSIAALAISCSKESGVSNKGDNSISFKTFVDKNARAESYDNDTLKQAFGVYGYWDEVGDKPTSGLVADFMLNQEVKYENKKFTYTPIKYWPNTGDVDFYAYTPYNLSNLAFTTPVDATTKGYPVFTYKIDPIITSQADLLVADAEDQDGTVASVNFVFNHALTKVGFAAKTHSDYQATGAVIKITGITLNNIINSGTFSYDRYVNQTNKATWWTLDATKVNYAPALKDPKGVILNYRNDDDESGNTYAIVNASNQYLLAMPQNFNGTDATLKVDYSVSYGATVEPFSKTFPLTATAAWTPGTFITYAIDIHLNMVTFTATVNKWKTASQEFVIVPTDDEE